MEAALIQNSLELYKRLWQHTGNLELPSDTRSRFASGASGAHHGLSSRNDPVDRKSLAWPVLCSRSGNM